MSPYILDNDISMIMCDDSSHSDNDNSDIDRFIMSLEEEFKSGVIAGISKPTSMQTQAHTVTVDATPTTSPSRIRMRPSHSTCDSGSVTDIQCSSPCSSLGGSSTSSRSLRSREPTIADFLKSTGQNMKDISFSDLRKYTDRNLLRLAGKREDLVACHKTQEEDELLEVNACLDDGHEDFDDSNVYDPLDLSLCEMSFDEEEEEDLLLKASLNSDCARLEVEGIMLLSQLEAEQDHMSSSSGVIFRH
jgi:hypothetical protein